MNIGMGEEARVIKYQDYEKSGSSVHVYPLCIHHRDKGTVEQEQERVLYNLIIYPLCIHHMDKGTCSGARAGESVV